MFLFLSGCSQVYHFVNVKYFFVAVKHPFAALKCHFITFKCPFAAVKRTLLCCPYIPHALKTRLGECSPNLESLPFRACLILAERARNRDRHSTRTSFHSAVTSSNSRCPVGRNVLEKHGLECIPVVLVA